MKKTGGKDGVCLGFSTSTSQGNRRIPRRGKCPLAVLDYIQSFGHVID